MSKAMNSLGRLKAAQNISLLYSVTTALTIWLIWSPGILSVDSLAMLRYSSMGQYTDMQPVFLPAICRLVFQAGGTLSLITLIQVLTGLLGIRELSMEVLRLIGGWSEHKIDRIALTILIVLSAPLTPLPVYLITLWTDTWLLIFLLWASSILLRLYRESVLPDCKAMNVKIWVASALIGLAMLVRYNGVIIYPAAVFVMARILHTWRHRFVAFMLPLAMSASFMLYESSILKPTRWHVVRTAYALDLASMIDFTPSICRNLGLTSCELVTGVFPSTFVVGDGAIDFSFNQGDIPTDEVFVALFIYPKLTSEYFMAAHDHPFLLAAVKLLNTLDYIRPDSTRYFYQEQILGSEFQLTFSEAFESQRAGWFDAMDWVKGHVVLRWFGFVHAGWLLMNLASLLICFRLALERNTRAVFLGLILLIPASYYASYFIALTASEFRLMYPSMLLVQVITLTALAAWISKRISAHQGSHPASISAPSPTY